MGWECQTQVRVGKSRGLCSVHLENTELVLRGEIRRRFSHRAMKNLRVEKGGLWFDVDDDSVRIELGNAAPKWRDRILTPRTRVQKLGLSPGMKTCVLGAVEPGAVAELEAAAGTRCANRLRQGMDLVLLFVEAEPDLLRLVTVERNLAEKGAVWVMWPKGRPDLAHKHIVEAGKRASLAQTRSMGFSERFTGLRFVRAAKRGSVNSHGG